MKAKCSAFYAKEIGTSSYRCASKVQQNTTGDHGKSMLTSAVGNIKPSLKHGHREPHAYAGLLLRYSEMRRRTV
jgi:hypothetical protein